MWNVLESARRHGLRRVVHMSSCVVQHPDGVFLSSDVRSKEGTLYGITKRLQEEMCRQFHDAYGLRIIIFRPASIGDSRLGISRDGLPARGGISWVCRHDLAEACHLALESETIDFDIMHTASHPEADRTATSPGRGSCWVWSTRGTSPATDPHVAPWSPLGSPLLPVHSAAGRPAGLSGHALPARRPRERAQRAALQVGAGAGRLRPPDPEPRPAPCPLTVDRRLWPPLPCLSEAIW